MVTRRAQNRSHFLKPFLGISYVKVSISLCKSVSRAGRVKLILVPLPDTKSGHVLDVNIAVRVKFSVRFCPKKLFYFKSKFGPDFGSAECLSGCCFEVMVSPNISHSNFCGSFSHAISNQNPSAKIRIINFLESFSHAMRNQKLPRKSDTLILRKLFTCNLKSKTFRKN